MDDEVTEGEHWPPQDDIPVPPEFDPAVVDVNTLGAEQERLIVVRIAIGRLEARAATLAHVQLPRPQEQIVPSVYPQNDALVGGTHDVPLDAVQGQENADVLQEVRLELAAL